MLLQVLLEFHPLAVEVVQRLRASIAGRLADVVETDRLSTSLAWFADFVRDTDRSPFVDPDEPGGKRYNQETLDLFAAYVRDRGSRKRGQEGKPVSAAHISAMVSTIRLARERSERRLITDKADNVVAPQLFRQMRKEDGPRGQRRLSRGLRAQHLRRAAAAGYERRSSRGRSPKNGSPRVAAWLSSTVARFATSVVWRPIPAIRASRWSWRRPRTFVKRLGRKG